MAKKEPLGIKENFTIRKAPESLTEQDLKKVCGGYKDKKDNVVIIDCGKDDSNNK